ALAGKAFRRGGPPHQISIQHLAGGGTQFEAIVTEHDENALRRGRKWRKSELRGVGHRCPLWIGQAEIIGLAGPPPLWRGRTVLQSPERPVPSPTIRPPNEAGTLSFYCA